VSVKISPDRVDIATDSRNGVRRRIRSVNDGSKGHGREPRPFPLWPALGLAIAADGLAAMLGAATGVYGGVFWHLVAGCTVALGCAAAALTGAELAGRRLWTPLGWGLLTLAPVAAGVLLAANSREHVPRWFANVLITAATLVIAGLLAGTLRLLVPGRSPLLGGVSAVAGVTAGFALVVTWTRAAPDPTMQVLLSLIAVSLLGYAAAALRSLR
jgi:hypothetical protein